MREPSYRRIALIKPSALGDIAHALPVLTAVRERFPEARITWIVNKAYEPLLVGHPHLTDTLAFDRGAFRKHSIDSVRTAWTFAAELRRRRFDLVIDLQGLLRTGLMCAATGSPRRIGLSDAREGSRYFHTDSVEIPDAEQLHAVDRYWRVAEALGAGSGEKKFIVPVKPEELRVVDELTASLPRPRIVVAPGARWTTKCWPPKFFAELLNRAHSEFGGSVVLVGGAEDVPIAAQVSASLTAPCLDLTGKTSIPRLVAVLARADLVIANDTGPLHLAAALGKPCVAPYTCTKIARHGPYGRTLGAVSTNVACAGSYLKNCPNGLICMTELTSDKLWKPLHAALTSWVSHSL